MGTMRAIIPIMIFLACACKSSITNDENEITSLLEKESATWRSGDMAAHANCWHIQPYSRILVSTTDGHAYDVPPQNIINPPRNQMDIGASSSNSNYKFSIHGDYAWVSHDEISISAHGDTTNSYEMRMLEKINGEWKIVAQSIHLHK